MELLEIHFFFRDLVQKQLFSPTFQKVHLVNRSKHVEFLNGRFYFGRLYFLT